MKRKILNFFLSFFVLLYIVLEELIWEKIAEPFIRYLRRLRILKKIEHWIEKIDSKIILIIFLMLFVKVELLGIYAGMLFVQGKVVAGSILYLTKIPIAAFTFWLFGVSKIKLLKFRWFSTSYNYMMTIIDRIKHSKTYINIKVKTQKIKLYIKKNIFSKKGFLSKNIASLYKKFKF